MELALVHQTGTQVSVICDGQFSHIFDQRYLILKDEKELIDNPLGYGKKLYEALLPPETPAQRTLATMLETPPGYLLLVAVDSDLDAIPWEYVYGPDGFLVLECHFVRGLPNDQRIPGPTLDIGLHIVAVPSNPLSHELEPLNIDGEWTRLKEIIQHVPYAITLERTRPPTIEQVHTLIANQHNRVIHFMGHGGQQETGAILCFEKDNGDLDPVTAKQLALCIRGNVFLVTLNACVSATPGSTVFSNLAAALVRQQTPYAVGMRFSIFDEDAHAFSRSFYNDLVRGSSVEEALIQARLTLAKSSRPWAVGVPVLYTSLRQSASGLASLPGSPIIKEHQPHMEVSALPRAEGTFQGRIDELKALGTALTSESRPPLVTIHSTGGQGKTTLAREAVERFAFAWPGGVWASSLENLPSREGFVNDLARFLGIDTQKALDPDKVEHLVIARLAHHRTLIVLDNAETLIEAVEANNEAAVQLAQFIRERLPRPPAGFLVTSRSFLGWANEIGYELTGLTPTEGVGLFQQHAPQRRGEIDQTGAWELSEQVEGHPLSLRLLSSAFNASDISFFAFVEEYETYLLQAENKYKDVDHRHRTLYASIETSVRYLDADLRALLSGLWIFRAPFLPVTATGIFDPKIGDIESKHSLIADHLHMLWQRGLLSLKIITNRDESILLYHLLPTMRSYVEKNLEQSYMRNVLFERFGVEYTKLAVVLRDELNRSTVAVSIAQQTREDLERGLLYVRGTNQGYYLLHWGWVLHRLGNIRYGLKLTEQALEIAQDQDRQLEMRALNNIAQMYAAIGQPQQALALYEQALSVMSNEGSRKGQASALNNMATVYIDIGQPKRALQILEQALLIMRERGDRVGEATTLTNMAGDYLNIGQPQQALALYEQALLIRHEMSDRAGEAATLNSMARVFRTTGQPQQALVLYEQALLIRYEVSDRAGEAVTLINIAMVYDSIGQPQRALTLYEQILPIMREVDDRNGEAATLNNMAMVHDSIGQPQRALELYEQALPIIREVGNRNDEAATLDNIASVYKSIGQPQRALALYEQALLILRETGNRAGEAITLNSIGQVYDDVGQPYRALALYEQALPIRHEVGDRAGVATTLNNIGLAYDSIGQPQRALTLYEQVLPIMREVNDRAGEASTLTNMARVYYAMSQPQRALSLLEQALPIMREVGDQAGETTTLISMAVVFAHMKQLQRALLLLEQALPISRVIGNRAHEATALANMAGIYNAIGQPQRALALHEQALSITSEVGDRMGEATTLVNMALGLFRYLNRSQEAITMLEQALAILIEMGLPQDDAGRTVNDLRQILKTVRQDSSESTATDNPTTLSTAYVQQVIAKTVAVLTIEHDGQAEWHKVMAEALYQAQQKGTEWQSEVDFFTAILAILDEQPTTLPSEHPYAQIVATIQAKITGGRTEFVQVSDNVMQVVRNFVNAQNWDTTHQVVNAQAALLFRPEVEILFEQNIAKARAAGDQRVVKTLEQHLALLRDCKTFGIAQAFDQLMTTQENALPFDVELIPRSIAALLGSPQEKLAHAQYLNAQINQTTDESLKTLISMIQMALFSKDFSLLRHDLSDMYRQAWESILISVELEGVDPTFFSLIPNNTLAVLGSASDRRSEWRNNLVQIRNQAREQGTHYFVALLDAVIGLLDADGNPIGLGEDLAGSYAKTWQAIIQQLS